MITSICNNNIRNNIKKIILLSKGVRNYTTNNNNSTNNNKPIKIYKSTTNNALFNIATEDWLFKEFNLNQQVLYLWRNSPTVVIGRYQNPYKECHLQRMEEDGVVLARRYSGGGAVYHDLGNTNFTFLSATKDYDKNRNTSIIMNSLESIGITPKPEASGRNDILVNGKKVSGSAYKQSGVRSFHHGTIMIDVNLDSLQKYLNPNKDKLKSKGITSVISRVTNMKTILPSLNHDTICDSVINEFCKTYNINNNNQDTPIEIQELNVDDLERIPSLKETYETLQNWDWRFGNSPSFEHQFEKRFDWGSIDININCVKSVIDQVQIFSDSLNPLMIESLSNNLPTQKYNKDGIITAIEKTKQDLSNNAESNLQLDQLKEFLINSI